MKLLYFSQVRESLGKAQEELTLPAEVKTVEDLRQWLKARGDCYAQIFTDTIHVAVDQAYARPDTPITNAQEIAFFPPVTGG